MRSVSKAINLALPRQSSTREHANSTGTASNQQQRAEGVCDYLHQAARMRVQPSTVHSLGAVSNQLDWLLAEHGCSNTHKVDCVMPRAGTDALSSGSALCEHQELDMHRTVTTTARA